MNDFAPLSWLDMLGRLALAVALGASIGMERELSEKAAGLRTNMLVALGSTLFYFGTHSKWTGPSRNLRLWGELFRERLPGWALSVPGRFCKRIEFEG